MIKCDDRAPSVPDVILQVISEILAESSQMTGGNNEEDEEQAEEEVKNETIDQSYTPLHSNDVTAASQLGLASVTSTSPPLMQQQQANDTASVISGGGGNNTASASSIARVMSNYHHSPVNGQYYCYRLTKV